jgi:hypothetical protein
MSFQPIATINKRKHEWIETRNISLKYYLWVLFHEEKTKEIVK